MLITTDGLITRSYPVGDHDRVVHLVTPEHGRLSVMVKGGQSKTNRHAAITQPFTYGNYELYHKSGEMYWLRGGSVLHSFYLLTGDLTSMALATYLCDVTSELTGEGENAEEILRLMLNTLHTISTGQKPLPLIKGAFELRAAAMAGYMPDLEGCAVCGTTYPDHAYLDVMNGSVICADCQTSFNRQRSAVDIMEANELGERRIICPMTASTLAAVRYAVLSPHKKIFSFALKDKEEELNFARVAEAYLLHHLERGFDTLDFYHSVEV
ncbi:MAG: DNA repair protein RecO [Clostridia bacterium]|nr:DNA repair protein RecO [Clostridia bacterium]